MQKLLRMYLKGIETTMLIARPPIVLLAGPVCSLPPRRRHRLGQRREAAALAGRETLRRLHQASGDRGLQHGVSIMSVTSLTLPRRVIRRPGDHSNGGRHRVRGQALDTYRT
jgi:hypothetical protein